MRRLREGCAGLADHTFWTFCLRGRRCSPKKNAAQMVCPSDAKRSSSWWRKTCGTDMKKTECGAQTSLEFNSLTVYFGWFAARLQVGFVKRSAARVKCVKCLCEDFVGRRFRRFARRSRLIRSRPSVLSRRKSSARNREGDLQQMLKAGWENQGYPPNRLKRADNYWPGTRCENFENFDFENSKGQKLLSLLSTLRSLHKLHL